MDSRVMIVEDSTAVRAMLRVAVRVNRLGRIVAEAGSSAEANRLAAEEQPDVVVLDLALSDASGHVVYDGIRLAAPETQFVIFSAHESERRWYADQGLTFVAKSDGPAGIVAALSRQ